MKFVAVGHRHLASQPPRVRPRWADRPLRRHQGHRHVDLRPGSERREATDPGRPAIARFDGRTSSTASARCWRTSPLFPDRADGSLVHSADGQIVGSSLIGQPFTAEEYFHPCPSVFSGYAPGPGYSYGSNYGPTNEALLHGEDDPETADVDVVGDERRLRPGARYPRR